LPLKTTINPIKQSSKIETTDSLEISNSLIVEDNLINQKVLAKLLEKIQIQSEVANNGQEGIDMFLNGNYDIIFMDINMPEMDGYEATEIIRQSKKYQSCPIPIIAVTASAFEEDRHKALERGMDDFITKPIVLKKLQEAVIKQFKKS
jgi:CheY-like chemotaxis protein